MMSNYLKNALLNWVKSTAFPADPATVYLAFFSDSVNAAGTGTEVTNLVSVIRAPMGWGSIVNNEEINAGQISISNAFGNTTVVSVGIYDAQSGGNLLFFSDLLSPLTVTAGSPVVFPINTFKILLT